MKATTQRVLLVAAWTSFAASLLAMSYFIYQVYVPKAADVALEARTERVVLEVTEGGPAFGWPGLETYAVDGAEVTCAVKSLLFGDESVRVTVSVSDGSSSEQERSGPTVAGQWARVLRVRLDRLGNDDEPYVLSCSNGERVQVRRSTNLWLRGPVGKTVNLPIYAKVLVGGIVDPQGGPMSLLRSGTLRASSRLKGSPHLPVSNQIELRLGDEVSVMPDSDNRESLSVGVMRFDGADLDVVTHARGAFALLRRGGLGTVEVFSLRPGFLALVQGNPMWSVVSLICGVVSALLGLILAGRTDEKKKSP